MNESWRYYALIEELRAELLAKALASAHEAGQDEGALAEAKKLLRLQGDKAFGPPDAGTSQVIEQLDNLPRLEKMLLRLLSASSWQELLGPLASKPRKGRRRPTS
jgi:hypothetical protein